MARVVVVGGGIAGLTAALTLAERTDGFDIELREAGDRLGGKLHTTPFAGRPAVDEGADAFLARVPHATALATRLGVAVTSPEPVGAAVWHRGLYRIPDGLLLGVPADLRRVAGTRLLTWRGKLRAAVEPLLPATDPDDAIGALIRRRFGNEVHTRLVDALVGSIYGADTDRFSLAMVPQLAELAGRGRSLLVSARRMRRAAPPATGPVFHAPSGGMADLAAAVAAAASNADVTIHRGAPVSAIERDGRAWRVDGAPTDAVVLATPAAPSAPLLTGAVPDLASVLRSMDHAGVALVTVAVDAAAWPDRLRGLSGYLVTKDVQHTVTAVSFGSQKWAHWRRGDDEVLRISLGRDGLPVDDLDDTALVDRAVTEVGGHLGVDLQPSAVRISRWPAAFPQYRPGHRDWLAAVTAATPPGLFLTGASYRGIGVPACIADAERTATTVTNYLRRCG